MYFYDTLLFNVTRDSPMLTSPTAIHLHCCIALHCVKYSVYLSGLLGPGVPVFTFLAAVNILIRGLLPQCTPAGVALGLYL